MDSIKVVNGKCYWIDDDDKVVLSGEDDSLIDGLFANVLEEEKLAIHAFVNRFEYDPQDDLICLPNIRIQEEIFPEEGKDEYLEDLEADNVEWVVWGINHEYLHRIMRNFISMRASYDMDNLANDEEFS